MNSSESTGLTILILAAVVLVAVVSNRLSERIRVPAPFLFLVCAAAVSDFFPAVGKAVPIGLVEQVVTVALIVILFDGGLGIGWGRFRAAAVPIVSLGVAGTILTTGAVTLLAHFACDLSWRTALLLGAALAPTDPAVVFSVLGRREITGRTGTILEGESGTNDPVGIALMVALLGAGGSTGAQVGQILVTFVEQMAVGVAVGAVGGFALLWFIRKVPLPGAGLHPVRALAGAGVIYGAATVAHGSGFLAVLVAGVLLGDESVPYRLEIRQVCSALASLAEIVVFVALGATIGLEALGRDNAWLIGLVLAVLLAFVVRPLLVGPLLLPVRMRHGERAFVLWAGLKGAVPILLGGFAISAGVPDSRRIYEIIFMVVAFSVLVQGGSIGFAAKRLGVPMEETTPTPWSFGVRLPHEPVGTRHYTVKAGDDADGTTLGDVVTNGDVWVSTVLRDGHLLPMSPDTVLRPRDELLLVSGEAEEGAKAAGDDEAGAEPENEDGTGDERPGEDGPR
ncbi:cation:proton antiporter domain-containing protein [Streptomyces montanisoli]|uniref:Cation:proton antiporter n=1 Tax=Streptomyces montanisoli TaxID=2798581 RepID=A0A940MCQ0_9ACTN|nr:cation:proton antiporter [Streptomyces montanisoli]MBP0456631.1 cation:proton antiporter [Streptomyces montanisoli]